MGLGARCAARRMDWQRAVGSGPPAIRRRDLSRGWRHRPSPHSQIARVHACVDVRAGGCSTLGSGHESTQATHTVTGRGEPHLRTREYRQILLIAAAHTLHSSRKLIHRTSSKNHRPRSEHQTHVQVRKAPLVIDPMLPPRLPVSAIPAAPSHRLRLHSRCVHDDAVSSAKFEWCGCGHGGAHAHPPMAGRQ